MTGIWTVTVAMPSMGKSSRTPWFGMSRPLIESAPQAPILTCARVVPATIAVTGEGTARDSSAPGPTEGVDAVVMWLGQLRGRRDDAASQQAQQYRHGSEYGR